MFSCNIGNIQLTIFLFELFKKSNTEDENEAVGINKTIIVKK